MPQANRCAHAQSVPSAGEEQQGQPTAGLAGLAPLTPWGRPCGAREQPSRQTEYPLATAVSVRLSLGASEETR